MPKKKITSKEGWLGDSVYYDQNGKKIGSSRPGFLAIRCITMPKTTV